MNERKHWHFGPWDFGVACLIMYGGIKLGEAYFNSKKVDKTTTILIEEK